MKRQAWTNDVRIPSLYICLAIRKITSMRVAHLPSRDDPATTSEAHTVAVSIPAAVAWTLRPFHRISDRVPAEAPMKVDGRPLRLSTLIPQTPRCSRLSSATWRSFRMEVSWASFRSWYARLHVLAKMGSGNSAPLHRRIGQTAFVSRSHPPRSDRNSEAGSTPVTSRWSRARVQAT